MNYLNSYLRSKLDLSQLGFIRGEKESGYFCTPVLSKVIGWAGVDGIHFCISKNFGEIVFAVSPANLPGEYVHPVARNFEDFLRLLLACYDTAAIEQCWFMDREVFEDFVSGNQPDDRAQKCLEEIRKKYKLMPMDDPFGYMHKLQNEFDYDSIVYPPEYYEIVEIPEARTAPEWKVTWDGDFFDGNPDTVGAEPIAVDTWFQWAGIDWYVPEVYPFDRGVVMHLLGRIDPSLVPLEGYDDFISPEAHEQMMAENPLNLHARHEVSINELAMRPAGSMGITWVPDQNWNVESKWFLEHYDLDLNYAWQIHKVKLFWPACGKMDIRKMSLTMKQHPVSISGTHFKTPDAGNCVILTQPQTEKEYILHIDEIKQETADFSRMHDQTMEYPNCLTQMVFRIEPELSRNQFRIVDCAQGDQPRYRSGVKRENGCFAVSLGIIGGADGPTAMIVGQTMTGTMRQHTAMSSMRFEHAKEIEWRIVFQEKPNEDYTVTLI